MTYLKYNTYSDKRSVKKPMISLAWLAERSTSSAYGRVSHIMLHTIKLHMTRKYKNKIKHKITVITH